MNLEQLERNTRESLSNANNEDKFNETQMEIDKISDQEEQSETDSMNEANAGSHLTEKHTHEFYFVKFGPDEFDQELQCTIDKVKSEIQMRKKEIDHFWKELTVKREESRQVEWNLRYWTCRHTHFTGLIHQKQQYLFQIQNAFKKSSTHNRVVTQSPDVKDLTNHIRGLKHRVQGKRLTLKEENQLIKQLKELTVEKVELYKELTVEKVELYKYNKISMKQCQSITGEIDILKASLLEARKNIQYFERCSEDINNQIANVMKKMDIAISKQERAKKLLRKLNKEMADKLNEQCNRGYEVINNAKEFAAKKDIAALEELSRNEMEKFFSKCTTDKAFREHCARRAVIVP